MKPEDIILGLSAGPYLHKESNRLCYVCAVHVDDGAALIIKLYNKEGTDVSGEMRLAEASDLSTPPIPQMTFVESGLPILKQDEAYIYLDSSDQGRPPHHIWTHGVHDGEFIKVYKISNHISNHCMWLDEQLEVDDHTKLHNPNGVSDFDIDVDGGWRLLSEHEVGSRKHLPSTGYHSKEIEQWDGDGDWIQDAWGNSSDITYRTKAPLGSLIADCWKPQGNPPKKTVSPPSFDERLTKLEKQMDYLRTHQ